MAQVVGFAGETELPKMTFYGVAVNVKLPGRTVNVAVVKGEPMKKIMEFQVVGQKTPNKEGLATRTAAGSREHSTLWPTPLLF